MALLGAHLSTAGGVSRAARAAAELGCECFQLFLRAPGRWQAAQPADAEIQSFLTTSSRAGLGGAAFAHAPYLLNPASDDPELRDRTVRVLVEELVLAGRLGLAGVVLHPGSAGAGERRTAERRCAAALSRAVELAGPGSARLLLEGTAGAGGLLGRGPAELGRIASMMEVAEARAPGICLDTAHLWGAGYDLRAPGWGGVLDEIESAWHQQAPDLFHGNDTAVPLGSRKDRHQPPGEGILGEEFYRRLFADSRFSSTPVVVEIPPGKENELIRSTLGLLRSWSSAPNDDG